MVRRTFQQVKARDPDYAGGFSADEWSLDATPPAASPSEVAAPEPQEAPQDARPSAEVQPPPVPPKPATTARATPRPRTTPPAPPVEAAPKATRPVSDRAYVPVRVRARADQVDRIVATGLRPGDVLKAAWRKASSGYEVGPEFVEPEPAGRAGGSLHYNTTLIVDAAALAALAREHDPLGVRGGWWLLRGQVEPRLWDAIEEVLAQVASSRAR